MKKFTDLPILDAVDVAGDDVLAIVDTSTDTSKQVSVIGLRGNGFLLKGAPIYITTSGTYTPSAGTRAVLVQVQGAGGAGGLAGATGSSQYAYAGGGSSGAYSEKFVINPAAATIVVGAAGIAGASPTAGGASSYSDGTNAITAQGGAAGESFAAIAEGSGSPGAGGVRVSATGGDKNVSGFAGFAGLNTGILARGLGGKGADSLFGSGGPEAVNIGLTNSVLGSAALGFGAGGAGGGNSRNQTATNGGNGAPGLIIITEYR